MSVGTILQIAGSKMGLDSSVTSQKNVLLRFLNEGAQEVYRKSDGILMEQVFKVNGDQTISLPSYVGPLRAIREFNSQASWSLNQMRPRYNQFNWKDIWKNWRIKGRQALQSSVVNESVGVITVNTVETPPIVVTVSGPTANSSLIHESVMMDAVSKNTTNQFSDYSSVKKDRVNTYDVTLSDVDGKVLTVIPNNELQAQYQIVDVSSCPWLPESGGAFDNYVELLYKQKLAWLSLDADEFPFPDHDFIIANTMIKLWKQEQDDSEGAAIYKDKAREIAADTLEDQNRATEDTIALVANPHDTLHRRIGSGNRRRFGYLGPQ